MGFVTYFVRYEGEDDETKGLTCTPGLSSVISSTNKSDLKCEQLLFSTLDF